MLAWLPDLLPRPVLMSLKFLANPARFSLLFVAMAGTAWLTGAAAQPAPEPMFPAAAAAAPGEIRYVTVETARYRLALENVGDEWLATDRGFYPVAADLIEPLVATVVAFTEAEMTTDAPADYAALDVVEPGPDTEAIRVTIADGDGEVLADAIIGAPGVTTGPPRRSGLHVRRAGEAEVWLTEGIVSLPRQVAQWFGAVARVPGPTIQRISILEGERLLFTVEKSDFDTGVYDLVYLDEELGAIEAAFVDISAIRALAGAIVTVAPDEVLAEEEVTVAGDARTIRYETVDGLVIDFTEAGANGAAWFLISAEAASGAAAAATEINELAAGRAIRMTDQITERLLSDLSVFYIIVTPADGASVPY